MFGLKDEFESGKEWIWNESVCVCIKRNIMRKIYESRDVISIIDEVNLLIYEIRLNIIYKIKLKLKKIIIVNIIIFIL